MTIVVWHGDSTRKATNAWVFRETLLWRHTRYNHKLNDTISFLLEGIVQIVQFNHFQR